MIRTFHGPRAVLAVVAFSFVARSLCVAVPMLRVSDGVQTLTITDNATNDASPIFGQVNYAGNFNGWNVSVASGITKPIIGSSNSPELDLTYQISRGAGSQGTLTVAFSENGFIPNSSGYFANSSGGTFGTATSSVMRVRSYYDSGSESGGFNRSEPDGVEPPRSAAAGRKGCWCQ